MFIYLKKNLLLNVIIKVNVKNINGIDLGINGSNISDPMNIANEDKKTPKPIMRTNFSDIKRITDS